MKKIYNQPKLNIVTIEEEVAIAASTSTVYNFGVGGGEYQAPTASEEWDWQ